IKTHGVEVLSITVYRRRMAARGCSELLRCVRLFFATIAPPRERLLVSLLLFVESDSGFCAELAIIPELDTVTAAVRGTLLAAQYFGNGRKQKRTGSRQPHEIVIHGLFHLG